MNQYQVSLVLAAHENVLHGDPLEERLTAIVGVYQGDLDSLWVVVNERSRQRAHAERIRTGAYFTKEEEEARQKKRKRQMLPQLLFHGKDNECLATLF